MGKKQLIAIGIIIAVVGAAFWYAQLQGRYSGNSRHVNPRSPEKTAEETKAEQLACIAATPIRQRLGQKLMAAGYASQLQAETAAFAAASVGGVIVMDGIPAEHITALHRALPIPPIIAVDQEGGSVQRYKNPGTLPSAAQIAMGGSAEDAYQRYLADSQYLREQGITTNFAPVVDVISRLPNPLPGRMYSSDPSVVTDYAAANIRAAKQAGLTPVIKHFPGLGSATGNTDFTVATTDPLLALRSRDLIPYEKLAPLHPDVMIGNMIVPDLTDGQPATWSSRAVTLLRNMGYQDAVVYSDSLTADAIPGSPSEAAVKAWQAGIDVAVVVQRDTGLANLDALLAAIIGRGEEAVASGAIDSQALNQSVLRVFTRKNINACELGAS